MKTINKKISLIILAITSLMCSRAMFMFFNDPEGPNLLIVVVTAAIVYLLSLAFYVRTGFKKLAATILLQILIVVCGFFALNYFPHIEKKENGIADYKKVEYMIDGTPTKIENDVTYFGNELHTDLNDDGREDVVFIVTQNPGGSGTFFYVVAALNTEKGYVGSDGYLLGDRIAPQTIEVSKNSQHKGVVVVNFADRKLDEPMSTPPSVTKSTYLKLDTTHMQWGIVPPDFEGESR